MQTNMLGYEVSDVAAASPGSPLNANDEACARYSLSIKELTSWQRAVHRSGMPGLPATRIRQYRDPYERGERY